MRRYIFNAAVVMIFIFTGCSTFIRIEESEAIKLKYQEREFVLQSDLIRGNLTFPKDTSVKLIVNIADDWIKIYAYRSDEELLKSNRLLLFYMFRKDFPDEKFSQEYLDKELLKIIRVKSSGEPEKKVNRQKPVKQNKKVK